MAGTTTTNEFKNVTPREVDFVTRFTQNWDSLKAILGITNAIKKAAGTKLVSYEASMVDSALQGGSTVPEGDEIPFTQFKVEPVAYGDIEVEKYAKSVSIESVAKYGATVAVQKTDDAFLVELQNKVLNTFYTFLKTGTLKGSQKTFQRALAIAKGAVLEKFASMNKTVTDVVAFVNILDLYEYLGDAPITVQSAFGMQYVEDFLGYKTIILLGDSQLASGQVIALPVENIDLYYIDPSESAFAQLGLNYVVDGETPLIGFHAEGDYSRASGDSFAIMGMNLWAEYLDGIAIVDIAPNKANSKPAVATSGSSTP